MLFFHFAGRNAMQGIFLFVRLLERGVEVSVWLHWVQSTKCYTHTSQTETNDACVRTMLEALKPLNLSSSGTSVATTLCTKSRAAQLNPIIDWILFWKKKIERGKANVTSYHITVLVKWRHRFLFPTSKISSFRVIREGRVLWCNISFHGSCEKGDTNIRKIPMQNSFSLIMGEMAAIHLDWKMMDIRIIKSYSWKELTRSSSPTPCLKQFS